MACGRRSSSSTTSSRRCRKAERAPWIPSSSSASNSPTRRAPCKKGRFEIVRLGGLSLGRATYEPGWKWSLHVGPTVGAERCTVGHVGLVLSGTATAAFDDGTVIELRAGQLFHIPAVPHDSWVVGDEPYVSLHFMGAEHYATRG